MLLTPGCHACGNQSACGIRSSQVLTWIHDKTRISVACDIME